MTINRNFDNNKEVTDQIAMAKRFETRLNQVGKMLEKQGPTYSTWIRFQLGKNPDKCITFNTSSTDKTQNLISSLNIEKSGAGVANKFVLKVAYDPFNFGQNPTDDIELLDELLAEAMAFNTNSDLDMIRGYLQYGYNYTEDSNVVSPKYQFVLTNVESEVQWESGITVYTFTGCSEISMDCDYTPTFDAITADMEWGRIDYLNKVLYYYYGDENNKPTHTRGIDKTIGNTPGYAIDIPDALFTDQELNIEEPANSSGISPWVYCLNLLYGKLSKSDQDSGIYSEGNVKSSEMPRYIMYITDNSGIKTIHVNYVSPKDLNKNLKINYEFTWSKDNTNIIEKWKPNVNLQTYLIQRMQKLRGENEAEKVLNETLTGIDEITKVDYSGFFGNILKKVNDDFFGIQGVVDKTAAVGNYLGKALAKVSYKSKLNTLAKEVYENYDAQITILGIPADIPIGCEISVKPVILQSVSRTSGVYMITGCTDTISSSGIFSTTLELVRLRGLD